MQLGQTEIDVNESGFSISTTELYCLLGLMCIHEPYTFYIYLILALFTIIDDFCNDGFYGFALTRRTIKGNIVNRQVILKKKKLYVPIYYIFYKPI